MTHAPSHGPIQFGTDGWRSIIAEQFTFANAELVTRAIAKLILSRFGTERPVIVGYDLRFQADRFAQRTAEILTEYGLNVHLADTWYPTPMIALCAKTHHSAGAFMFTASHNPPEYLGIKFIPEYAGPAMPDITNPLVANVRELEANPSLIAPPNPAPKPGTITRFSPEAEYRATIGELVQLDKLKALAGKKVLFDPMYGASQSEFPYFIEGTGIQMETIHHGHDPLFGGRMPEPKAEFVPELMQRVPKEGFAVGLASDGDGDRFGVVDETGHFITANEMLPMVFRHLYKNRGFRGCVVRSVATSMLIDCLADKYGVEVVETPVGFKWIGQLMRDRDVIIGGEESGGFSILGFIPEKDGILANLLILEMMAYEQKPLKAIYEDTLAEAGQRLYGDCYNYHFTPAQKDSVMKALTALKAGDKLGNVTIEAVDTRDGVKLHFGRYDWLLIRPSGTEPVVRAYWESTLADQSKAIAKGFEQWLEAQNGASSLVGAAKS